MNEKTMFQQDQEAAEENRRRLEKGKRLLCVIVAVSLLLSLFSAVFHTQFTGILLQLVLAFFIFRGSAAVKGFYLLFVVLSVVSGFLCFVRQNVQAMFALPAAAPAFRCLLIGAGVFTIAWGVFSMFAMEKSRNLAGYLEYQKMQR